MKKKTLRAVVVGYGDTGEQLTRLLAAQAWCRVVAVVDPSAKSLEKATSLYQLSTFRTLAKALEATSADVAIITTPARLARDLAHTAMQSGLQVLVAQNPRDALRALAALRGTEPGRASPENR